jgi:hypothetical protein
MHWVDSIDEFYDFISLVVAYAPDEFPEEDFLEAGQQLNLDKAFDELNRGMDMLAKKIKEPEKIESLKKLLADSLSAYQGGDDVKGAHLLQEFEIKAFK